jgi:hypothetical protein
MEDVVYLAQEPAAEKPLFVTTDFDVISEFLERSEENYYDEMGVVSADTAREIMDETYE